MKEKKLFRELWRYENLLEVLMFIFNDQRKINETGHWSGYKDLRTVTVLAAIHCQCFTQQLVPKNKIRFFQEGQM